MTLPVEPEWRFIVTDLDGETITLLDRLASERIITPKLDEPLEITCSMPSDNPQVNIMHTDGFPFVAEGVRQLYCLRLEDVSVPFYTCRAAGLIMQVGDAARSNDARTRITAWDPWQYMFSRPVLQSVLSGGQAGLLIDSDGIVYPEGVGAHDIVFDILNTSWSFALLNAVDAPDASKPMFLDIDQTNFEECSDFVGGYKIQQATTVGQALQDLCATGYLDIVIWPIYDPVARPGILGEIFVYSQSVVGTLSSGLGAGSFLYDQIFSWDMPGKSAVMMDDMFDGVARANILQFYNGQGGPPVTPQVDDASVAAYGPYWDQHFFPAQTEVAAVEAMAAEQLFLRSRYKQTLTVNPASGRAPQPFNDYYLGDRVPVYASDRLRQPLPTSELQVGSLTPAVTWQRIYGIPVEIDDNGVETVRELLVGPVGAP
jgi:hypothetical protein